MDRSAVYILIVDDSSVMRRILKRILTQAGISPDRVYEAENGCEGLKCIAGQMVQLVFSDVNMPNMDGLEFLRTLKSAPQWKDIPVVMVSAEGSEEKVMEAIDLGAVGYVKKPFSSDLISDQLTGLLLSR
jgi:two-component system chemotaxis response regulator CheY